MALTSPNNGDIIQATHITQLTGLVAGTSGKGQVVVLTDVGSSAWNTANSGSDASTLWALTVRNQGTGGQAFRVQDSAGTTVVSAKDSAVVLGVSARALNIDTASSPSGPRAYIVDTLNTRAVMTLTRGTSTTSGLTPDGTYTGALMVTSFQTAGGEAIKGAAYLASGTGAGFSAGVSGVSETPSGSTYTPTGTYGNIGVLGQATVNKSGTNSARAWGGNFLSIIQAGDASVAVGAEIDVEVRSGATVQDRYGLLIATTASGASGGTNEDIGLKFANKNSTAGNRWADAVIAFNSPDDAAGDGWPCAAGGTLIKAYAPVTVTATGGIDFEGVSFSSFAIKSTGFLVNGAGRMGIKVAGVDGTAPLRIDCTGDTNALALDNASGVVQTTVGGAGAASALPGAPAGYLILKIGGTQQVIPYWAKS